jgi:hypothetical protein
MIKIIIALIIILIGILLLIVHIKEYKRDTSETLLYDLLDSIFFFPFVGFILPLGLIILATGWLIYLLINI